MYLAAFREAEILCVLAVGRERVQFVIEIRLYTTVGSGSAVSVSPLSSCLTLELEATEQAIRKRRQT